MPDFKVGDRARIKELNPKTANKLADNKLPYLLGHTECLAGQIVTIREISKYNNVRLKRGETPLSLWWHPNWLEKVSEEVEDSIYSLRIHLLD